MLCAGGACALVESLPKPQNVTAFASVVLTAEPAFIDLPDWLTLDFILRVMDSKVFSAIYWGAAAIVVIIGFFARMKYRDRNLKKLLDDYVDKARKADGRERQSVKEVIGRAITKARGLAGPNSVQFRSSDVFENAARLFAQRQAPVAIDLLRREAAVCEATVNHALQQVRHARIRAANGVPKKLD